MSKVSRKTDRALSAQQGLFDTALPEGTFDILLGLKQLMSREMSACGKDRYLIAAEISRYTGRDISKDMLDKYVSSEPAYRPPGDIFVPFCHVVGSLEVFRYQLEFLNADVLNPEDRDLVRLARLEEEKRRLDTEIMQLRAKRGIR